MIAQLSGIIVHANSHSIVIDVNGVGYKVWIGSENLQKKAVVSPKMVNAWC